MPDTLVLTTPVGQPNDLCSLQTDNRSPVISLALAAALVLTAYGSQAAWAINAATGSDSNAGTPAAPLATMAELSSRLSGQLIRQATTVSIVGNVTDSPLMLSGTRFASGASLAVNGTRTQLVAGGTISVVATLGALGTDYPWQITTAGVDWTLQPAGAQIRFSNSTTAFIVQVIDANNVVVVPTTSGGSATVPTTLLTFTVESIPSVLPPYINALIASAGTTTTVCTTFTDLSLSAGGCSIVGAGFRTIWCEVQSAAAQQWELSAFVQMIGGRVSFVASALFRIRAAPTKMIFQATVFVTASGASGSMLAQGGFTDWNTTCFQNSRFQTIDNAYCAISNGMHLRNTNTNCVTVDTCATICILNNGRGSINGPGTGAVNAGTAFNVTLGHVVYGATAKPTLTATDPLGSIRLGSGTGPIFNNTTIGTGKTTLNLDAIPPLTNALLGVGCSSYGQVA